MKTPTLTPHVVGESDAATRPALLQRVVIVGVGAAGVVLIATMLWPFLPAIVTAIALATLVLPAHAHVERRFRHRSIAAFVTTAAVFLLVLLPAAALAVIIGGELADAVGWIGREGPALVRRQESAFSRWLAPVASAAGLDPDAVLIAAGAELERLARLAANRALVLLTGLGGWALQGGAALFALYYLLKDQGIAGEAVERLLPFERVQTKRLVRRSGEVLRATIYGNVLVAIIQGTLGGLAFALLGLPGAALWGAVMAVLSLLPVIGAMFVWVPAAVYLLGAGRLLDGVLLMVWGTLVISTVDNLLRAVLVSGRAQLHPLIVFFSVLGGLVVFGAAGILLGPVTFIAAYTTIELARETIGADTAR